MVMKNHHAGMDASEQPAQESRLLVVARRTATGSRLSHRLPDLHRMHPLTYRFRESPVFQGEDESDRDSDGPRHRARSPAPCGMVYGGQHTGMDDMWGDSTGKASRSNMDRLSVGASAEVGCLVRKPRTGCALLWYVAVGHTETQNASMTIRLHTDVQVKASS